jgi:hypothetical protein
LQAKNKPVSYAIWIISNAERANNALRYICPCTHAAQSRESAGNNIKESEGPFDVGLRRHWINSLCASFSLCSPHTQNTGGQLNIVTIWLFVFPLSRASDRLVKKSAQPNEFNERNFARIISISLFLLFWRHKFFFLSQMKLGRRFSIIVLRSEF